MSYINSTYLPSCHIFFQFKSRSQLAKFTTLVGGFAKAIVPPKPIKFERDLREPDGKEQENEEQNHGGDSSQTGDFRKRPFRAA